MNNPYLALCSERLDAKLRSGNSYRGHRTGHTQIIALRSRPFTIYESPISMESALLCAIHERQTGIELSKGALTEIANNNHEFIIAAAEAGIALRVLPRIGGDENNPVYSDIFPASTFLATVLSPQRHDALRSCLEQLASMRPRSSAIPRVPPI